MKRELTTRWCVSWQYVDRSQLLDAVRVNDEWRDEVIDTMQPMDDHDRDNIQATVYVENLDELRALLIATAGVKSPWGVALCIDGRDGKGTTAHAALVSKGGQLGNSPLTVYAPDPTPGANPAYDKLHEASRLIREAMNEGV